MAPTAAMEKEFSLICGFQYPQSGWVGAECIPTDTKGYLYIFLRCPVLLITSGRWGRESRLPTTGSPVVEMDAGQGAPISVSSSRFLKNKMDEFYYNW